MYAAMCQITYQYVTLNMQEDKHKVSTVSDYAGKKNACAVTLMRTLCQPFTIYLGNISNA